MGLFSRTKSNHAMNTESINALVEVVAHKEATQAQIREVEKANDALRKVLESNHFSIMIKVAVGGHQSAQRKKRKA